MSDKKVLWVPVWVWDGIAGFAGAISVTTLVGALVFAFLEYQDRRNSARAAETLKMIEIWELRGAERAYLSIATELADLIAAEGDDLPKDADELANLRRNLARRALRSADPGAYDAVIRFFTRLSLCVRTDICSSEVSEVFFLDTVVDFRKWFGFEVERRRGLNSRHAQEFDSLLCHLIEIHKSEVDQTIATLCQTPNGGGY